MATKEFVIRIQNETHSGAGNKIGGAGGIGQATGGQSVKHNSATSKTLDDKLTERLQKMLAPAAIIGGTKRIVDTVANYQHSLIEVRTGNQELQQRVSFAYNTASGFVGSALSGAMTGTMIAPGVGTAVGAVLGIAKEGMSMGVNAMMKQMTLTEQRRLEQMQQNLAARRVTVSGSRYMNASQM
jgi:hypothetical protein